MISTEISERVIVRHRGDDMVLAFEHFDEIQPRSDEAIVRVEYTSLNRGEVARSLRRSEDGYTPGWDFAGTVERAAANGEGPAVGTRVVGMLESGAWAQRLTVPARQLATLPAGVSLEVASTLPIAGLTALYALEKYGSVIGKNVLVTGASGGMGQFAVQLAAHGGAFVTALTHRNAIDFKHGRVKAIAAIPAHERYDLVIDGVGDDVFSAAAAALAPHGMLISVGATKSADAAFNIRDFFNIGYASIYGFLIFDEVLVKPAADGLARLMRLIENGAITAPISYRGNIREIDRIARDLLDSKIPGKAVLAWS